QIAAQTRCAVQIPHGIEDRTSSRLPSVCCAGEPVQHIILPRWIDFENHTAAGEANTREATAEFRCAVKVPSGVQSYSHKMKTIDGSRRREGWIRKDRFGPRRELKNLT